MPLTSLAREINEKKVRDDEIFSFTGNPFRWKPAQLFTAEIPGKWKKSKAGTKLSKDPNKNLSSCLNLRPLIFYLLNILSVLCALCDSFFRGGFFTAGPRPHR
jgi:hypothetical protein